MKTIKQLFAIIILSITLASCSTDSVDETFEDTTTTVTNDPIITTASGQTVDVTFIQTTWVMTERSVSNNIQTTMPCGQSEVTTKLSLNSDGSMAKYSRSGDDCTEYREDGTYTIVGSTLRMNVYGQNTNYTLNTLDNTNMSLSYTSPTNGITTAMSFTDTEFSQDDDNYFILGDWVLVNVMINDDDINVNTWKCGNRFESLTFDYLQNTTEPNGTGVIGTCSVFKNDGDCSYTIDEAGIPYNFDSYRVDTDGYMYNDLKFLIYTSNETLELFVNEISFDDNSTEYTADGMGLEYYNSNGDYIRLVYERPY